jgi:hypothetical protein
LAELGRLWAGRVFGTNTGNLFVELTPTADGLTGVLRFMDAAFGLVVYEIKGFFDGTTVKLHGKPNQAPPGIETGEIEAQAVLTAAGHLRGRWASSLGTGGTFELFPHDLPPADQTKQPDSPVPEQLHTARLTVGAVRLYADDVRDLALVQRRDFSVGRLIVTYRSGGIENTRYFEDFEQGIKGISELQYLKISIQEPEAHGINKVAIIELDSQGRNDVIVQGIHESWVIGKSEALARQLRRYEKNLVTNTKKYGLGFNQFIFLAMLVLFPEIEPLWRRVLFAGIVVALLWAIFSAHQRFLPNVVVYVTPRKPGLLIQAWPSILSWLITATASLAAAIAFYFLTRRSPF